MRSFEEIKIEWDLFHDREHIDDSDIELLLSKVALYKKQLHELPEVHTCSHTLFLRCLDHLQWALTYCHSPYEPNSDLLEKRYKEIKAFLDKHTA